MRRKNGDQAHDVIKMPRQRDLTEGGELDPKHAAHDPEKAALKHGAHNSTECTHRAAHSKCRDSTEPRSRDWGPKKHAEPVTSPAARPGPRMEGAGRYGNNGNVGASPPTPPLPPSLELWCPRSVVCHTTRRNLPPRSMLSPNATTMTAGPTNYTLPLCRDVASIHSLPP
jgi:hypothetical protein